MSAGGPTSLLPALLLVIQATRPATTRAATYPPTCLIRSKVICMVLFIDLAGARAKADPAGRPLLVDFENGFFL